MDGKVHENQKDRDEVRDYAVECLGIKVLRFTNIEIYQRFDEVLGSIKDELEKIK